MTSELERAVLTSRQSGILPPNKQSNHINDQEKFFIEKLRSCNIAYNTGEVCLEDITLPTCIIGSGGFSRVHKVRDNKGHNYALKTYFSEENWSDDKKIERKKEIQIILQNVTQNKRFVSQEPFLKPIIIADSNDSNWYILEYLDGKNVECLMKYGELTPKDRQRSIFTYTEMLLQLHDNGMCFGDNNWGTVILNETATGICDYDSITPQATQKPALARMQNPKYATKQWLEAALHHRYIHEFNNHTESKENDRENFMYMILATYGIDVCNRKNLYRNLRTEMNNHRVPRGLHTVAVDLLDGFRLVTTEELAEAVFESVKS